MIKKLAVFVFALVAFAINANAQLFNTGDKTLDANVKEIDNKGAIDFNFFKKDMATTYSVPETKVVTMQESGMKPGDIYMALETAKITKKPVEDVCKVYTANKEKGWGAIAKELGIKPGSAEFKALKNNADAKVKKQKSGKAKPKK